MGERAGGWYGGLVVQAVNGSWRAWYRNMSKVIYYSTAAIGGLTASRVRVPYSIKATH